VSEKVETVDHDGFVRVYKLGHVLRYSYVFSCAVRFRGYGLSRTVRLLGWLSRRDGPAAGMSGTAAEGVRSALESAETGSRIASDIQL
jgi:hypothetical protein